MSKDRSQPLSDGEGNLVRDLYPKLRRFAAVIAPADLDPDDLMQEALVKTLRSHRLSDLEHPSAYLWKAMCSLATDHSRTETRRRSALNRLGTPTPHEDAYPSDLSELDLLRPQERAVLYMREIEGLPYRDVAEILGGREATMRRTASRARRSLREFIGKDEIDATA